MGRCDKELNPFCGHPFPQSLGVRGTEGIEHDVQPTWPNVPITPPDVSGQMFFYSKKSNP